jgi:3,4-dihydroxy 2-butanone 4-phosphate synthase/GTP cyclohydrolase II
VRETAVETIDSHGGSWALRVFTDAPGGAEHLALVKGDLNAPGPVLVRMHVLDVLDDVLGARPARQDQIADAMHAIAAEGRGCIVLLRDMSPNALTDRLHPRSVSPTELRQYGVGAQILGALGVHEMILLTNSPARRIVGLEGYGLSVVETRPFSKAKG